MKLRQLQAFKTVLDEGSITLAAKRFGITQPAMSTLIAKLEDEIGFSLFDRHKGRLRATPEAVRFHEEVDQALNGFDKVARTARDIRDLSIGQLRVASFPGLSLEFLPRVVAEFVRKHPDVNLSLQTRSSIQVKEWLASQLFDIGIAELPVDHPAVEVEPFSVDCVCALPDQHPLTQLDIVTPAEIATYPFISLNPDHMTHFRLKRVFEMMGIPWQPHVECQLFAPTCSLVAQGVGVSIIDPFTATDFKDRGIVIRPFEPTIPFDIGILYPALRPHSLLTDKFSELLKSALKPYKQNQV